MDADTPLPTNTRWQPLIHRIGKCFCGYPVFFRNYLCLHCGRALGYQPDQATVLSLEPTEDDGLWKLAGAGDGGTLYRRCANFDLPPQCNWVIAQGDTEQPVLCRCCRLNRMVPDQSVAENGPLWHKLELAKRRLVSSLIAMGLPVASRIGEDPQHGLAFDLLADVEPMPVTTGHQDGIITLNINEADDAAREAIRSALHEPYRTLLGHVRHESGHYYWNRLLENSIWHEPFRALFGDERQDYGAALQQHYANGPDPDWADNCVSAYASSHPWEDWAETWAHYLHMVDTLDTAIGSGMDSEHVDLLKDPFDQDVLYRLDEEEDAADYEFLAFFNAWAGLTSVLNEFSLGMGLPDFYPFVLSKRSITKLHFVHRFIQAFRLSPELQQPLESTV
ncbi:MAG: putative zinc-binding metallopeptidase [Pseudomonadota bacterium]